MPSAILIITSMWTLPFITNTTRNLKSPCSLIEPKPRKLAFSTCTAMAQIESKEQSCSGTFLPTFPYAVSTSRLRARAKGASSLMARNRKMISVFINLNRGYFRLPANMRIYKIYFMGQVDGCHMHSAFHHEIKAKGCYSTNIRLAIYFLYRSSLIINKKKSCNSGGSD